MTGDQARAAMAIIAQGVLDGTLTAMTAYDPETGDQVQVLSILRVVGPANAMGVTPLALLFGPEEDITERVDLPPGTRFHTGMQGPGNASAN